VDRYLGEYGIKKDNARGRRALGAELELRCVEPGKHAEEELWKRIRRGWQFGDGDFVERLSDKMGEREAGSENVFTEVSREQEEVRAKKIIAQELKKESVAWEDLAEMNKTEDRKIRVAIALRKQTPMSMGWIASAISAGKPTTLWTAIRKYTDTNDSGD
jgi:hypothetical protein